MEQMLEELTPTAVVAARVRELRGARSAEWLAREMQKQGIDWTRLVVTKLETGRRKSVSVEELLALAAVLNVSPLHLLVPPYPSPLWGGEGDRASDVSRSPDDPNIPNDNAPYQVTPATAVPCYQVRQWVRAYEPLPGGDFVDFMQTMPAHERLSDAEIKRRLRGRIEGGRLDG
jgi:transcriptional regulator with XRE-family HTH domain